MAPFRRCSSWECGQKRPHLRLRSSASLRCGGRTCERIEQGQSRSESVEFRLSSPSLHRSTLERGKEYASVRLGVREGHGKTLYGSKGRFFPHLPGKSLILHKSRTNSSESGLINGLRRIQMKKNLFPCHTVPQKPQPTLSPPPEAPASRGSIRRMKSYSTDSDSRKRYFGGFLFPS
jgi:hypothetical protein